MNLTSTVCGATGNVVNISTRRMQLQHERFVMTTLAKDERAERDRRRRLAAQQGSTNSEKSMDPYRWPPPLPARPVPNCKWNFKDLCNQRATPISYDSLAPSHTPAPHSSLVTTPLPLATSVSELGAAPRATISRRWAMSAPSIDYTIPSTAPPGLVLRASASPPRGVTERRAGESWAAAAAAAAKAGRQELDSLLVQRIHSIRRLGPAA
jgi:hypothetical protein